MPRQIPQQQAPADSGTMRQIVQKVLEENGLDAKPAAVSQLVQLVTSSPGRTRNNGKIAAKTTCSKNCAGMGAGKTTDSDLAAVIAAWSELPQAIRTGILAMVRAAAKG